MNVFLRIDIFIVCTLTFNEDVTFSYNTVFGVFCKIFLIFKFSRTYQTEKWGLCCTWNQRNPSNKCSHVCIYSFFYPYWYRIYSKNRDFNYFHTFNVLIRNSNKNILIILLYYISPIVIYLHRIKLIMVIKVKKFSIDLLELSSVLELAVCVKGLSLRQKPGFATRPPTH